MNKPEHTLDEFYLKPCPFCGGDAIIRPIKSGYRIRCTACHIERNKKVLRMPLEWLHGEMIKDWNERVETAIQSSVQKPDDSIPEDYYYD